MHCCGQNSGIPDPQQPVLMSRMHDGGGSLTAHVVVRQNANAARSGATSVTKNDEDQHEDEAEETEEADALRFPGAF